MQPFQTDPEVPVSVKRGLDTLIKTVATVDHTLQACQSPPDEDPTDAFFRSLLKENPKSKVARKHFELRKGK